MGKGAVVALRTVQWLNRAVQFGSAALVLGVYLYFLVIMGRHGITIPPDTKAVAGISGIAVIYTAASLALFCCLAGRTFFSFLAILLDFCFIGSFAYVAVQNKDGTSSCNGQVNTIFGSGNADTNVASGSNADAVVNLHLACKLETACLAVSIIAIIFFIFSMVAELGLARLRKKEQRIGPSPANNYTSGYGSAAAAGGAGAGGFFGRLVRRRTAAGADDKLMVNHDGPDKEGIVESPEAESYQMNTTTYGITSEHQPVLAASGYGAAASASNSRAAGLGANKYAPENYGVNTGVGGGIGDGAYAGADPYGGAAESAISLYPAAQTYSAEKPYRA